MFRHPFLTVLGAEIVTAAVVIVGWNLLDRHPLHLGDRGVRVIDHLRDLARM